MGASKIIIKGAREHNLKNIDIELPRDQLIVFSGLSGSGKSSLAFDTIYAEGQRRYVESLSSYARQFLGQMNKPDVDYIEGLSPAISVDQKTTSKNPRSTVGTVTEIYDYLRLLYARIGIPHCTTCGKEIQKQTVDQIVDKIMQLPEKSKIQILAPIVRGRKGEYAKELDTLRKSGFVRVRIDGISYDLSDKIEIEKNKKHNIEVIVDRLVIKEGIESRLADSIETSSKLSSGLVICDVVGDKEILFSQNYACPEHGTSIEEMSPRMFSFNNPYGACDKCSGLGILYEVSEDLIIPDRTLSINQGAIQASGWSNSDGGTIAAMYYTALGKKYGFTLDTPICEMSKEAVHAILYGTDGKKLQMTRTNEYGTGTYTTDFEGIINNLNRRYKETTSEWSKAEIEQKMMQQPCPECNGARLKKQALAVTVGGINIDELSNLSVKNAVKFFDELQISERDEQIARLVIKEIKA
ncbi:MAG: excinuclease ABC subunit UvrA, partial [Clostridia bacterium]|nr:excinuclease ABC subunit UvrA [Clostridia bacterium]